MISESSHFTTDTQEPLCSLISESRCTCTCSLSNQPIRWQQCNACNHAVDVNIKRQTWEKCDGSDLVTMTGVPNEVAVKCTRYEKKSRDFTSPFSKVISRTRGTHLSCTHAYVRSKFVSEPRYTMSGTVSPTGL